MDSNVIQGMFVTMLCIISSSNYDVVKNFTVKTNKTNQQIKGMKNCCNNALTTLQQTS